MSGPAQFTQNWYKAEDIACLRAAAEIASAYPGAWIELGCHEGRSALEIVQFLPAGEVLRAVDTWPYKDIWERFKANLDDAQVVAYKMDAITFLDQCEDAPIAFVHIDADHSYEHVFDCLERIIPRSKGIICGHDYIDAPGVNQAVKELLPGHTNKENFWSINTWTYKP